MHRSAREIARIFATTQGEPVAEVDTSLIEDGEGVWYVVEEGNPGIRVFFTDFGASLYTLNGLTAWRLQQYRYTPINFWPDLLRDVQQVKDLLMSSEELPIVRLTDSVGSGGMVGYPVGSDGEIRHLRASVAPPLSHPLTLSSTELPGTKR